MGILLAGCLSPAASAPERRARVAELLARPIVPVVYEARPGFAVVTVGDALTLSSGFAQGAALRARFGLESPAGGFARAMTAALRAQPRSAGTDFRVAALSDAGDELAARAEEPVLYTGVSEWRLLYDLSLTRYRLVLGLTAAIVPASIVAEGRGAMALPGRLWRGFCTTREPDPTLPMEAWLADDGAFLRAQLAEAEARCGRFMAERLSRFVERGEEQGAFDFGELGPAPRE